MTVDNNEIQSFVANSSITDEIQELTSFPDGVLIRCSHPSRNWMTYFVCGY